MRLPVLFVLAAVLLPASSLAAQPLTAEQAVARMLRRSPSLRAADAEVRAASASVRAARGARAPVFVAGTDGQVQESLNGTGGGIVRNSSTSVGSRIALRHTTDIGTQIEVGTTLGASWRSVNLNAGTTDSVTVGPTYSAQATFDVRQPLLRGRGRDATLSSTRQARASEAATEHGRDETVSRLVHDTLVAYWELWYAQQAVAVEQEALAVAERQLAEHRLRVTQLGTVAPADLLQLSSERASIAEALAVAERARRARAIALGRFVGAEPESALLLVASSSPPEPAEPPPVSALARTVRASSSELRSLRSELDASRHRLRGARAADRPRLDLLGSFAAGGVWDERTIDRLALPGDRPAFGALVGLELELPIGSSQYEAEHDVAHAQLSAAEARYDARVEELVAEVATLRSDVETAAEQVRLSTETAQFARELAEAESQRLALGTSTPLALVQARQSQREAELRRLRAIVDRLEAELGLSHRTGALAPERAAGRSS